MSTVTTVYFSLGVFLLIAVCVVTYFALTSFAETEARVARTHQVQAEIGQLQRGILESIVARRAYAADRSPDRLAATMPAGVVGVSESGLQTRSDLERLTAAGYRAFLIGERFMTDPDPARAIAELIGGRESFFGKAISEK